MPKKWNPPKKKPKLGAMCVLAYGDKATSGVCIGAWICFNGKYGWFDDSAKPKFPAKAPTAWMEIPPLDIVLP